MNDHRKRFDDSAIFFAKNGSGWMKLTKEAAENVLKRLLGANCAVSGIEAGIWHAPGFEARLDGILSASEFAKTGISLEEALIYFKNIDPTYDTFIITLHSEIQV